MFRESHKWFNKSYENMSRTNTLAITSEGFIIRYYERETYIQHISQSYSH